MPRIRKRAAPVNRPPTVEPPYTLRRVATNAETWDGNATQIYVSLESTSEPHMPAVWLRIERQSWAAADAWQRHGKAEIIVLASEVELLLKTLAVVVAEARRTGVLEPAKP